MGCDIHPALEVRRKGIWRYYTPKDMEKIIPRGGTAEDVRLVFSFDN